MPPMNMICGRIREGRGVGEFYHHHRHARATAAITGSQSSARNQRRGVVIVSKCTCHKSEKPDDGAVTKSLVTYLCVE